MQKMFRIKTNHVETMLRGHALLHNLFKTRKDQEIVISGRESRQITAKKNKDKVVAMEFVVLKTTFVMLQLRTGQPHTFQKFTFSALFTENAVNSKMPLVKVSP